MNSLFITMLTLGMGTALTPCPLASNIAAILYLSTGGSGEAGKGSKGHKLPLLLYSLGRILAYVGIATLLNLGLSSAPTVSYWLQEQMPLYLGPILLIVALIMLDVISLPSIGQGVSSARLQALVGKNRLLGSLGMGFVFALALCPPSAAILFGIVLPQAAQLGTVPSLLAIACFGLGTALPVLAISVLLIISFSQAQKSIKKIQQAAPYIKKASGIIFLLLGFYLICTNILFI